MHFYSIIVIFGSLATLGFANFHVGRADKTQITHSDLPPVTFTQYIACPSNYLNCNCYGGFAANADRGVQVSKGSTSGDFSLNAGLCGMGQLDFYYRANLGHWEFYVDGGDGSIQGTCYKNDAKLAACGLSPYSILETNYDDQLVCYSYICGN